jgi:hypothetical protein
MNKGFGLAALIGIYAALVLDVFSSTNSSPQTTELFASERAGSLWRWVKLGAIVSVAFVILAAYIEYRDKTTGDRTWLGPIIGGTVALLIMMAMYSHALKMGGGAKPTNQSPVASW